MTAQNDDDAKALSLARSHLTHGDIPKATSILLRLAIGVTGNQARLVSELLLAVRRPDEATELAVKIAGEHRDSWSWVNQFAGHMRARGDLNASTRVIRAFITAHSDPSIERMHADLALALGLPSAYRSINELDAIRDAYLQQLHAAVASYPPTALREIGARADDFARSNFYLAYQGCDDVVAQTTYGDWLVESLDAITESTRLVQKHNNRPTIITISSKWHECTIGWYFAAWVEHLSRTWNVILAHTPGSRRDSLTLRLAAHCHDEITLPATIDAATAQIRNLSADIALYPELGSDGFTFALAAQRLAPSQVCAWGHPVTAGLSTIDAYITCEVMEPADADRHYREKLIRLPGIGTRYTIPDLPPKTTRADLGLPEIGPLYFMPQALYKWHPHTDQLLVEIVRRDAYARFVVFELRPPSPALVINQRLLAALGEVSPNATERLIWMPECSRRDYLRINRACSIMIDTPCWSGGNASLDTLLCGVPVVTLPGRFMRGRQSLGMLKLLGCDELIANSVEEFAEIAVAIANDETRRNALREKIQNGFRLLTQDNSPLFALDTSLRELTASRSPNRI